MSLEEPLQMDKTAETDFGCAADSKCLDEVISNAALPVEDAAAEKSPTGVGEAVSSELSTTANEGGDDEAEEDGTVDGDAEEDHQVTSNEGGSTESIDPYGYLTRGDFSSEIFKVELMNLPKRFGIAQLRKKLVFMGLSPCKIKTVEQRHFAFVTFRSEADRQKAFEVLQGHVWKNRPIRVKMAAANADPLMLKRKQESGSSEQSEMKRPKNEDIATDDLSPAHRLNNSVTPTWAVPYEEQLKTKDATIREFVRRLGRQIEKNNETDKKELREQWSLNGGLCCQLHPIKPSPSLQGYRNKCEFTIGRSPEGKDNTVGFRLGAYREGVVSVLEPDGCVNIPPSMKTIAKALQSYLQTESNRSAFNPTDRQGYWKEATVRTTRSGGVMVIIGFHPQSLSQEEIEKEKLQLSHHFESLQFNDVTVSALYFQVESDRKDKYEDGACDHLLGEKFIEEDLLGMKFRISPLAFFQVNSEAAEVLYGTIADWCKITPNTTLLDICCGTGTIGLTMAKKVKKVIGIELSSQAVEDARKNAEVNGIENAEFLCGKAEDLLPSLMWRVASQDVVVVVDPPRAGLHSDVIRAIRKSPFVKHLIYVSCKPTAALSNIVDFTRQASKRVSGVPFRLMQAVPVDMFPHTEHCELVLMLDREANE